MKDGLKGFPKSLLQRYGQVEALGQGGMGAVFKVYDNEVGRYVALKVLSLNPLTDEAEKMIYVARFKREWHLLAELQCPDIVRLYDCGVADNVPYMTMEYVEGQPLSSLISAAPLSMADALNMSIQIAEALSFVHNAGILHRDIKPANIMVSNDNEYKLLDFGLASFFDRDTLTRLTESGLVLGTLLYIPPEYFNDGLYDRRSEVYELGVVLYECLTGHVHIPSQQIGDVFLFAKGKLKEKIRPPSHFNSSVSQELDELVLSAIDHSPEKRPQSMAEFARACRNCLERPETPGQTTALNPRPWPIVVLCLTIFLLATFWGRVELDTQWQKGLTVKKSSRSLELSWPTKEKRLFSYQIRQEEGNKILSQGAEEIATRSHRLLFRPLEPFSSYKIHVSDAGGMVTKKLMTKEITLPDHYFVSALHGSLYVDFAADCEGLTFVVNDGTTTVKRALPSSSNPLIVAGLSKDRGGAAYRWAVKYGARTLKTGHVSPEPRAIKTPVQPLRVVSMEIPIPPAPLSSPLWFGNRFLWFDFTSAVNCYQFRGDVEAAWFFRPIDMVGPPRSFPTLSYYKESERHLLLFYRLLKDWSFVAHRLDVKDRAHRWKSHPGKQYSNWYWQKSDWTTKLSAGEWKKVLKAKMAAPAPRGLALAKGRKKYFRATPWFQQQLSLAAIEQDGLALQTAFSCTVKEDPSLKKIPTAMQCDALLLGSRFITVARSYQRNKRGFIDWSVLAHPLHKGDKLLRKDFMSHNMSIIPQADEKHEIFYFAQSDRLWALDCRPSGRVNAITLPASMKANNGFLSAAVLRKGETLYLIRFERKKRDLIAFGSGTGLRGYLITYNVKEKVFSRYSPALIDVMTPDTDGLAAYLHHNGRHLIGFSGRSIFVFDEKTKRGAAWQPPRTTARLSTGSIGPKDVLAAVTTIGELFVVPSQLILAAKGKKLTCQQPYR